MSQGPQFKNPFERNDEPLVAELVESPSPFPPPNAPRPLGGSSQFPPYSEPPKSPSVGPILGCVAVAFVLVFFLCGGLVVAIFSAAPGGVNTTKADEFELPPFSLADAKQVLDGTWHVAEDDPRYDEIRKLLVRLEKASNKKDRAAFSRMIDWPTRMKRYEKAYRFPPVDFLEKAQLLELEQQRCRLPSEANGFRIAAVVEHTAEDWLVYAYAQQGDNAHTPYLFHFRQVDGVWKFVDVLEIPDQYWMAEYNALHSGPSSGDFACDSQIALLKHLIDAKASHGRGEREETESSLRAAEAEVGLPQLRSNNLHLIASYWYGLNRTDECRRLCEQISNPDRFPWAHYQLAIAYFDDEEHERALAAIERYEAVAGFHFELAKRKVQCLAFLKRPEVADAALALLRYSPNDYQALSLAIEHVPAERVSELIAVLPDDANLEDLLVSVACSKLYADDVAAYQTLRNALAEKKPSSAMVARLDAQLLHYQGDLSAAWHKYDELANAAADENARILLLNDSVEVGLKLFTPAELYRRSAHPREILQVLASGIEEGEGMVDVRDLAPLLELHRERDPDDPQLPRYAGEVAEYKNDYAAAATAFEQSLEALAKDEDAEEYSIEDLQSRLLRARFKLGQWREAYADSFEKEKTFRSLAAFMAERKDWPSLAMLCESHRTQQRPSDDHWLRYYELLVYEQRVRDAHDENALQQVIEEYKRMKSQVSESADIPAYLLDAAISRAAAERADWLTYFVLQENGEELFHSLLTRFRREGNEAALAEFIQVFRARYPANYSLLSYDLEELWRREEYASYVQLLTPWPEPNQSQGYYLEYEARQRFVISQLILGDQKAAEAMANEHGNAYAKIAVKMSAGDDQAVRKILAEEYKNLYATFPPNRDWLRVPAIQAYLDSAAYDKLRDDFPLGLDYQMIEQRSVLLLPAPRDWSAESVQQRIEATGLSDVRVVPLEGPALKSRTFRITLGKQVVHLTVGSGQYVRELDLANSPAADEASRKAWSEHQAWCALEEPETDTPINVATWSRLIAACGEGGDYVWNIFNGNAYHGLLDNDHQPRLAAGEPVAKVFQPTDHSWLSFGNVRGANSREFSWRKRCQAMLAANSQPGGTIFVEVRSGSVVEELPVKVTKIVDNHWGEYAIVGQTETDCVLNERSPAGVTIKANLYEIVNWRE